MVLHGRNDPLASPAARIAVVIFCVVELLPPTLHGIDVQAAAPIFLAPAQPEVQAHDARAGTVDKSRYRAFSISENDLADVPVPVALRPFEGRLQLEALALTFLVVGGDSFRGARCNAFDAKDVLDDV